VGYKTTDDLASPSARHSKTSFIFSAIASSDSRSFYEAGDSVCFQDISDFLTTRRHFTESTIPYDRTSCLISRHFVLRIRETKNKLFGYQGVARCSEMSVNLYQATRFHNPKECFLDINLFPHSPIMLHSTNHMVRDYQYPEDGGSTFLRNVWQISTRLHGVTLQKALLHIITIGS